MGIPSAIKHVHIRYLMQSQPVPPKTLFSINNTSLLSTQTQHHQQYRFFNNTNFLDKLDSLRRLIKINYRTPNSRTFSSRCSSSTKGNRIGFLKWYLGLLETRPLVTKCVSSSLIYAAADLTAQMITLPPSDSFDLIRTVRTAMYGLILLGPSQHFWFHSISRILPERDVVSTIKKITMGQVIYGPCNTTCFFSYSAALQGETVDDICAKLKRDLIPTLRNGLLYWPVCDFLTYKFVPVHLQPLVNSSFSYIWTVYLTYMASLQKMNSD